MNVFGFRVNNNLYIIRNCYKDYKFNQDFFNVFVFNKNKILKLFNLCVPCTEKFLGSFYLHSYFLQLKKYLKEKQIANMYVMIFLIFLELNFVKIAETTDYNSPLFLSDYL